MTALRNIAIIALLALGVAVLPGGGDAAETVLTALLIGFLVAIGIFAVQLYRRSELTLAVLTDGQRALLYGALGVLALMVAGADELLETGVGVLVWIALIALAVLAIITVVRAADTY